VQVKWIETKLSAMSYCEEPSQP